MLPCETNREREKERMIDKEKLTSIGKVIKNKIQERYVFRIKIRLNVEKKKMKNTNAIEIYKFIYLHTYLRVVRAINEISFPVYWTTTSIL